MARYNDVKKVMVDGKEELRGGKSDKSYLSAFRLGTYIATQFKPIVAKTVYNMTDAKKVPHFRYKLWINQWVIDSQKTPFLC